MPDKTRSYRMQRRAESQQQTRLRITESAVALHGSVGPSRTTISAVAAHAGVRRSTVYRHFPDETALFDACTAHWAALNALMAGRNLRGTARRRTRAALGHAIAFSTWKSLVREQRLSKSDAATLVRALVAAAS